MISRRTLLKSAPLWLAGCGEKPFAFRNTDISASQLGGDWDLHDFYGRPQQLADFHGKVVIVFFGYTRCPDICPSALAKYVALLGDKGISGGRLQIVFITLDPQRDTPERLREYLTWFHPNVLGLSGDEQKIADIASKFRVTAIKKNIPGGMGYVIDHSAGAYVFDPEGRLRLYLAENARLEDIAADVQQLLAGK